MSNNTETRKVTISPGGKHFITQPHTSILESGLSSGISLPFSCANGSCGDCRAKVLKGTVFKIHFHDFSLTEAEKLSGICLLCAYAAETDLTIEASEAQTAKDIPYQKLRGKLCYRTKQKDVTILRFKLTRGKALRFLSGQYAKITSQSGQSVSLPIANCPCEPDYVEFHIPPGPNEILEKWSGLDELNHRERVDIEGPHGHFTVGHSEQHKPAALVFIAIGIGFAAIKPLLEHVISLEDGTPCQLIWIATESVPHYMNNLCRSWNDAFDSFSYLPLQTTDVFSPDLLITQSSTKRNHLFYISGEQQDSQKIKRQLETTGIENESIAIDLTARL